MEVPDRLLALRRSVEYGKEKKCGTIVVNLELLDLILRGEIPVGGNELPPEEVTRLLYEVKAERDKLFRFAEDTRRGLGKYQVVANAMSEITRLELENAELRQKDRLRPWITEGDDDEMPRGDRAGEGEVGPDDPARKPVEYFSGKPLLCANCGEESTNPGQFVKDGRWVCTEQCRKDLPNVDSYDDLRASGGIVNAP